MKTNSDYRTAGFAGIFSALLFIISIIGMQYYLASNLDDVSSFTLNMNESHSMMIMYGWPGVMATVLIMPLVYVFYRSPGTLSLISKMFFMVTLIGLCFILVGYLFHLALTYFHAPMYHTLDEIGQAGFGALFVSTIGLQDMFWLTGDIFSFLGIAGLLLICWGDGVFPKWLLAIGILAGIAAAIGSLGFIPAYKKLSGLSLLFIGGFSVFAIWEILAGVVLLRMKP